MELTEFEVDSIYSRCLMELLQEGYVALFNFKGDNDSEIVLEKDGVAYLFCKQWDEKVTYSIELQPIPETYQSTSLKYKEVPLLRGEREQAIKVLGVYYAVYFNYGSYNENNRYRYYDSKEEAETVANKRKQRHDYHKWLADGVINEFKVTETPWKGYRKNVSICTTKNGWTLTNVNGKTTYVRKGSRWHDLKRV